MRTRGHPAASGHHRALLWHYLYKVCTVKSIVSKMIERPALFVCDIQTKFSKAIFQWDNVIGTTQKMLKAAKILSIPTFYTTQLREKLGDTVDELKNKDATLDLDKSLFSMCLPEVLEKLPPKSCVAIVGIESHICVTQTTLDLLHHGHKVYVLADGVSSCNAEEVPIALKRLQAAGATITTSESFVCHLLFLTDHRCTRQCVTRVSRNLKPLPTS